MDNYAATIKETAEKVLQDNGQRAQHPSLKIILHRINHGDDLLCAVTGEPIELQRLMILPRTGVSAKGARALPTPRKKVQPAKTFSGTATYAPVV